MCSDVCIPESADLQLQLPVKPAGGAIDPGRRRRCSPRRAASCRRAQLAATSAQIHDGRLVLTLGKEWGATLSQIKSFAFYPYDDGSIEYAAPQTLTHAGDSVELAMKIGYQPPQAGTIRGVLLATEQSGKRYDRRADRDRGCVCRRRRRGRHAGRAILAGRRISQRARPRARLPHCPSSCCWPSSAD